MYPRNVELYSNNIQINTSILNSYILAKCYQKRHTFAPARTKLTKEGVLEKNITIVIDLKVCVNVIFPCDTTYRIFSVHNMG